MSQEPRSSVDQEIPSGNIVIVGHAPSVKIQSHRAEVSAVRPGIIANSDSGAGTSIPPIEADGRAEVKKRTLKDKIEVRDDRHASRKPDPSRGAIIKPPGYKLRDVLRAVLGRKYVEGVIEPMVADMQHEYFRALRREKDWTAETIKWIWRFRIFCVVVLVPVRKSLGYILGQLRGG